MKPLHLTANPAKPTDKFSQYKKKVLYAFNSMKKLKKQWLFTSELYYRLYVLSSSQAPCSTLRPLHPKLSAMNLVQIGGMQIQCMAFVFVHLNNPKQWVIMSLPRYIASLGSLDSVCSSRSFTSSWRGNCQWTKTDLFLYVQTQETSSKIRQTDSVFL